MISLLSPAKNLSFEPSPNGFKPSIPQFIEESEVLINKLKKLSPNKISKLMKLNPQLSELNYHRYQNWRADFEEVESKAAIYAFNGEVYRGLSAIDFTQKDLDFAQEHLIILSGLHGILKPLDLIQPYRLEMGTKLQIRSKIPNLYMFWKDKITASLNALLEEQNEKVILNLASIEYFKSVDVADLNARVIHCQFLDWKGESYKAVMTWAKLARGMMAKKVITEKIDNAEELKGVAFGGYLFNDSMSTEDNFVFTRDKS